MKSEENCDDDDSAFVDDSRNTSDAVGAVVSAGVRDKTHSTRVLQAEHHAMAQNGAMLLEDDVTSTVNGSQTSDVARGEPKTMHIVIHNADTNGSLSLAARTLPDSLSCPPTPLPPMTPLPPPTPSTPLSRSRGFRYQWELCAFEPVIPVRCKSSNGELHKSKFGSGGRGSCIKMNNTWYTPNEFEAACGRSSSKDWKRSIHYGGRTLQCLIEDGLLIPHATCCTCGACCDDETVTGPVRWFIPYKRKKRDCADDVASKRTFSQSSCSNTVSQGSVSQSLGFDISSQQFIITGVSPDSKELLHVVTADQLSSLNLDQLLSVSSSSLAHTSSSSSSSSPAVQVVSSVSSTASVTAGSDSLQNNLSALVSSAAQASEQKTWVQLDEMANSLLQQAQSLKEMISVARRESIEARESALQQLRAQLESERRTALNVLQIESQMALSKALSTARTMKDIALQEALAQARAELLLQPASGSAATAAADSSAAVCSTCHKSSVNMWSVSSDSERDCEAAVVVAAAASNQQIINNTK